MLKSYTSLFQTWVKNVYSLCVEGVVTRAKSYTGRPMNAPQSTQPRVQPLLFTQILDSFAPTSYTANFNYFNLLSSHLYTLSTPPTINKMNKK